MTIDNTLVGEYIIAFGAGFLIIASVCVFLYIRFARQNIPVAQVVSVMDHPACVVVMGVPAK